MSWKAARSLSILPSQYPQPTPIFAPSMKPSNDIKTVNTTPSIAEVGAMINKY